MAVVSTNADLPRDTSISPLSDLPSIPIPIPMDDVWKDIIVAGAATTPPPPPFPLPAEGSSSSNSLKGKRRALQEPLDKATLQKQRRMIKNRESAARSRERKQAYTSELEFLVHQLEQDNARLLNEEAEMRRQRKKLLLEYIIPIDVMPKPKKKLRRVNSAQSL